MDMVTPAGREWWGAGVVLAAAVAVLCGCASMRAAAGVPIGDVGVIVGRWAGTLSPGDEPFYLTINPGGTLTASWGSNAVWGTVTTRDGKARFDMPPGPFEGTIHLYDDGGTRRLVLHDPGASFAARVEQ
jgi:hypothetical protein